MGKGEQKVKKEIRRTKINSAIIATVATVGIISVAAVAPKAIEHLGRSRFVRKWLSHTKSRVGKLIEAGYLVRDEEGKIRLTEKGERYAALMHEGSLAPKIPKRWDGKWRLLIFDIPEYRRGVRIKIRQTLATLGFVRLQDSVWVYPYDCEDFMTILKAECRIGKDVLYVIADHIEYDKHLREHFGLPKDV